MPCSFLIGQSASQRFLVDVVAAQVVSRSWTSLPHAAADFQHRNVERAPPSRTRRWVRRSSFRGPYRQRRRRRFIDDADHFQAAISPPAWSLAFASLKYADGDDCLGDFSHQGIFRRGPQFRQSSRKSPAGCYTFPALPRARHRDCLPLVRHAFISSLTSS